jgi:hypothetical protein
MHAGDIDVSQFAYIITYMTIENAIIYPLISLSKIEGRQRAANTLNDLWTVFWPRVSDDHSVDMCAVTSMGLYENISNECRHKKRMKCAKFYREYYSTIQARSVYDTDLKPQGYFLKEWDAMLHSFDTLSTIVDAVGRLRNYYDTSPLFRSALENLCDDREIELTKGNVAFFLEEFAALYLMGERVLGAPVTGVSLRRDDGGAVYLVYPGETSIAEIMAWNYLHGKRKYKKGRTISINTADPLKPEFMDMGDMVGLNVKPKDNVISMPPPKAFETGLQTF